MAKLTRAQIEGAIEESDTLELEPIDDDDCRCCCCTGECND